MKIILLSILLIFAIGIICEQSVFGSEELAQWCSEGYSEVCLSSEYIIWDKNRPLTWDDFQGFLIGYCGDSRPWDRMTFLACTNTQVDWIFWYERPLATWTQGYDRIHGVPATWTNCGYEIAEIKIAVSFMKSISWVNLDEPNPIPSYVDLLKHEQGHFDIAQSYAQKIKAHEGKTFACPSGVFDDDKIINEINNYFDEIWLEQQQMQATYDKETDHGMDTERQAEWNKKIISLLYVNEVYIPAWIKNNAGWWAEGQIDDSSFVKGIQFMVKVGIIQVR